MVFKKIFFLKHSIKTHLLFFLLLFVLDISVLFHIPFYQQLFGIILLTFLPGFIFISLMKLNNLDTINKLLLIIGLSIAFDIFLGYLSNILFASLSPTPLSSTFLMLIFNVSCIILYFINWITNNGSFIDFIFQNSIQSRSSLVISFLMIIFLSSAIIGSYLMKNYDNNLLLISGFLLTILVLIVFTKFHKNITQNIFALTLFSMALFITFSFALRSDFIIGYDVHWEFSIFRTTLENLHWKILDYSALDSCLSISILPTVFQELCNFPNIILFYKLFFSAIVSLTPVVIFQISRIYLDNIFSFFAGLLFASNHVFMWSAANPRTNIAILFFSLTILVLIVDIKSIERKFLFFIFTLSMIVSHYTSSFQFFFILIAVWILFQISSHKSKDIHYRKISLFSIFFIFVVIFLWYSQVTEGAFNISAIGFFKGSIKTLWDFLIIESRSGAMPEMLGVDFAARTIPRQIHIIIQWVIMALILIGLVISTFAEKCFLVKKITDNAFFKKYLFQLFMRKTTIFRNNKILQFPINEKIDFEFLLIGICSFGLLCFIVLVPQGSIGLGTDRTYLQMLVPLSVFFIIGSLFVSNFLHLNEKTFLLIILIPSILCSTGVLYQLFDIPHEPTFTSKGELYDTIYPTNTDVISGKWIINYSIPHSTIFYISIESENILRDYKDIKKNYDNRYIKPENNLNIHGYLHIPFHVQKTGELYHKHKYTNIIEFPQIFQEKSLIFNNGDSTVYYRE